MISLLLIQIQFDLAIPFAQKHLMYNVVFLTNTTYLKYSFEGSIRSASISNNSSSSKPKTYYIIITLSLQNWIIS